VAKTENYLKANLKYKTDNESPNVCEISPVGTKTNEGGNDKF